MSFVRDTLLKPVPLIWNSVAGVIGLASFFGLNNTVPLPQRLLGSACLFLLCTLIGTIFVIRDISLRAKSPVTIRSILDGSHFYEGKLIIILDKSNWIKPGQLLALVANSDGVQMPLALLSVETTTTIGYPQCIIAATLTPDDLSDYLGDRSRWRSLLALPDIQSRYLEAL